MYIATVLSSVFLTFTATAQAAPAKEPQFPTHPLVSRFITIDSSCQANHAVVEKVFSHAYYVSEKAQHMTFEHPAFTRYFLTPEQAKHKPPSKIPMKVSEYYYKQKMYTDYIVPEREDSKVAPNMFKSILKNGGTTTRIIAECPTVEQEQICKTTYAFVVHGTAKIYLCPSSFPIPGAKKQRHLPLDSKPFDSSGWCTAPPYQIDSFVTTAEIVLHEMTHIVSIARYALQLSLDRPGLEIVWWQTKDIYDLHDENDPTNTYGRWHINQASRNLRNRWVAYIAQRAPATAEPANTAVVTNEKSGFFNSVASKAKGITQSLNSKSKSTGNAKKRTAVDEGHASELNEPPLGTADNAHSYALAAMELFFMDMCKGKKHAFDPNKLPY